MIPTRWTAKRKGDVLAEMEAEPDRSAEIMERHGLSAEELVEWRLRLRVTDDVKSLGVYGRAARGHGKSGLLSRGGD